MLPGSSSTIRFNVRLFGHLKHLTISSLLACTVPSKLYVDVAFLLLKGVQWFSDLDLRREADGPKQSRRMDSLEFTQPCTVTISTTSDRMVAVALLEILINLGGQEDASRGTSGATEKVPSGK